MSIDGNPDVITFPAHDFCDVQPSPLRRCRRCAAYKHEPAGRDRCRPPLPTASRVVGSKPRVEARGWMFEEPRGLGGARASRARYAIVCRYLDRDELDWMATYGHPANGPTSQIAVRNGRQLSGHSYTIDWRQVGRDALARIAANDALALAAGHWDIIGLREQLGSARSERDRLNARGTYAPATYYVIEVK